MCSSTAGAAVAARRANTMARTGEGRKPIAYRSEEPAADTRADAEAKITPCIGALPGGLADGVAAYFSSFARGLGAGSGSVAHRFPGRLALLVSKAHAFPEALL